MSFRRGLQDRAGSLALRDDQLLALLMYGVDDRTPPEQLLVPSVSADVGEALPRGSIAHLITDGIAEILGDVELVGSVPSGRRRDLHRLVEIVADPRPLNGDLAEDRLECEGSCPPPLDAGPAFAVPALQNQFLVGLLHEDFEELALDLETGLMDVRLDVVGEMLIL